MKNRSRGGGQSKYRFGFLHPELHDHSLAALNIFVQGSSLFKQGCRHLSKLIVHCLFQEGIYRLVYDYDPLRCSAPNQLTAA